MGSPNALSEKDANNSLKNQAGTGANKGDIKSMDYHRQALQSKIEEESSTHQYISPSDNIMSPCTAKLSAFKNRQVAKAKPKSLFAQASAKKFVGDNVFGARNADQGSSSKPSDDSNQQSN